MTTKPISAITSALPRILNRSLKNFFILIFAPPFLSVCIGIVEFDDGRVERLLVENNGHVLVDAVSHILAGDGAAVLKVVLDEYKVEAEIARLLLHERVNAEHALAGDIVVHEHHIAVEVLRPIPHGVDIFPAADGVMAHGRLFGEEGEILDGLLRIGGGDHVVPHGGVHVQHDVDAPAVLRPGREVGIIDGGGTPQEGAVPRFAAEGDVFFLVRPAHYVDDLAVVAVEIRFAAVGGRPRVQAVERFGDAGERGVVGLEVFPLLKLYGVLLVHVRSVFEQLVPVVLHAVFLFYKRDGVFEHLRGVGMRAGLVVNHGEGDGEIRHGVAAALEHGGRLGGVAGHVRRNERPAEQRERVVDRDARLRGAARADIRGQAVGLCDVDIIRLYMLVNIADDKLRQRLQGDGVQALEASEKQRGEYLVMGYDVVGLPASAETAVICQHEGDFLGQALHDGVHVHVRYAQLRPAVALEESVDEHERAEVGAHPAVLPEALHDVDRGGRDHGAHGDEIVEPLRIIVESVLYAAPFAVFRDAGFVNIATSQAARAVLRLPQRIKALQLLVDFLNRFVNELQFHFPAPPCNFLISRDSINAWKRVRS